MSNTTTLSEKFKLWAFISLCLYGALQCISISAGNYALGLCVFFSLVYGVLEPKEVKRNFSSYRWLFVLFALLFGILLLSALSSGNALYGLKIWFFKYFYRLTPLFIALLVFPKGKYLVPILFLTIFSCLITSIGGILLLEDGEWRVKAFFGHQMTLAGFLCILLPFIFGNLIKAKQTLWSYLFWTFLFLFFSVVLLLNGTRGAWIACFIAFLFLGIWAAKKSKKSLITSVLFLSLICATIFFSPRFSDRALSVTSTSLTSNTERILMWKSATQMFLDHPFLGVGLGNYKEKYQNNYIAEEAKERKQEHAHSNIFQMLGENGIVGLAAFSIFFLVLLVKSLISSFKTNNLFSAILFATTLSLFVQGLTEFNFGNSSVIRMYWLQLATLLVLMTESSANLFSFVVRPSSRRKYEDLSS